MQSHRIISGLTVLVMIVLVAAGWFLVAQPQLAAASTANDQAAQAQTQIASTQATLASLKSEQKNLSTLKEQAKGLQLSIPANVDSSAYIRGLDGLAAAAGVTITTITVADPQAYVPPVVATPVTPATTATASPSPSASASAAATPMAPVDTGWTPTTDALITSSNFVAIPVTITVDGQWDGALAFIKGLQSGSRLFLVTGFTTKQGDEASSSGGVTANISGFIYALIDPKTAAVQAAAEKAAADKASETPTPTPTPTVSSSPNPSSSATPTPTPSSTPTK
jgi:Tfp pilus assembly protein PilO